MVICNSSMTEMKDNSSMCNNHNNSSNSKPRTATTTTTSTILRGSVHHRLSRNMSVLIQNKRNTKAEFKRLKTILPSIRRKENVSKLDIILEAIKYIDDLQDQLIDRLGGPRGDREATILALTASTTQGSIDAERLKDVADDVDVDDEMLEEVFDDEEEDEDLISLSDGYMSDPGLAMLYHDDDEADADDDDQESDGECSSGVSNASLEL